MIKFMQDGNIQSMEGEPPMGMGWGLRLVMVAIEKFLHNAQGIILQQVTKY